MVRRMRAPLSAVLLAGLCACASKAAAPVEVRCAPTSGDALARLPTDHVVAAWKGGQLTYGELLGDARGELQKLQNEYLSGRTEAERKAVQRHVIRALVGAAARAKGQTEDVYIEAIAGAPDAVPDAEIEAFYAENAAQIGQPLDAVRGELAAYLGRKGQQERVQAEVERLKAEAGLTITLPEPELAAVKFDLEGRPRRGKPDAKVTVVVFSDFECPYCKTAVPAVDALLEKYPDDVQVVFFQFPLSFHASARPSAIASLCAHDQGQFWAFHDALFAAQSELGPDLFAATATTLGLDAAKFEACLADPKTGARVDADLAAGREAVVGGTPSFFVDGRPSTEGVPTVEAIARRLGR